MISLKVPDFRTIEEALIPLDARAVVLFGANDAGKTNILDAIEASLTGTCSRGFPFTRDVPASERVCELEFELDGLGVIGHQDELLFCECADSWLHWLEEESSLQSNGDELDSLREQLADEKIMAPDRALVVNQFNSHFLDYLRTTSLAFGEAASTDWLAIESDYRIVLDAHLASRRYRAWWVLCAAPGGADVPISAAEIDWLAPRPEAASPSLREAQKRLASYPWDPSDPLCVFGKDPDVFLSSFGSSITGGLREQCTAERVEFSTGDYSDLSADIEAFIRSESIRLKPTVVLKSGEVATGIMSDFARGERSRGEGWLVEDSEKKGAFCLRPIVDEVCKELGCHATELAPPPVRKNYEIRVVPNSPIDWSRQGRILVRLAPKTDPSQDFDLSGAAAGIAMWVCFALRKAMHDQGTSSGVIYLVDEPEQHLHPLAQEEMAKWIMEYAPADACTVIATHAAPFLDLGSENVRYIGVIRENDCTVLKEMTRDVLGALEKDARDLGLSPVALIQLARGWLFVEGEDDRRVFKALFGKELSAARIRVLAFRGAPQAKVTLESLELIKPFGLPLCVVLDNARPDAQEEKIREQLKEMSKAGLEVLAPPFRYPDIVAALPEQATKALMVENGLDPASFRGWDNIVARWESLPGPGTGNSFKAFARKELGFEENKPIPEVIIRGLELWDSGALDDHPLTEIVKRIIAYTDERAHRGSVEAFS